MHGDKQQSQRDWTLKNFKSGRTMILVATDVAARGIHVNDIGLVVNYDFPNNCEDYVHRIGRTGRAGKTGNVVSFFNIKEDGKKAGALIKILKKNKQEVPQTLLTCGSMNYGGSRFSRYRGRSGRGGSFRGRGGRNDGADGGWITAKGRINQSGQQRQVGKSSILSNNSSPSFGGRRQPSQIHLNQNHQYMSKTHNQQNPVYGAALQTEQNQYHHQFFNHNPYIQQNMGLNLQRGYFPSAHSL